MIYKCLTITNPQAVYEYKSKKNSLKINNYYG